MVMLPEGAGYGQNEELNCVLNCEDDISKFDDELSDGTVSRPADEMAIQLHAEPGTKDRQCQAFIEAKGRQCLKAAIGTNIYCSLHLVCKKEKIVKVLTPICRGTTIAGTRCKHHSHPGFSFCKKHWHSAETGQTSNSNRHTFKRKAEESCSGSIRKDLVLVHPESPLEINPVSVINDNDSFFAKNILGEPLMLSGNDQWKGSPNYGNDHNKDSCINDENAINCKVCFEEFLDNQTLGNHWMENHKKEAQFLFRSYTCAICLDSFTNKKLLESHVQKRHCMQVGENCLLSLCIPCGSGFGNKEEFWLHVKSVHPAEFKLSKAPAQLTLSTSDDSPKMIDQGNEASLDNDNSENPGDSRKLSCRFCGLKFDSLPDLGRHHQAAHMERDLASRRLARSGVRYNAYRLKSGRLSCPKIKGGLEESSNMIRRRDTTNFKRRKQAKKLLEMGETSIQPRVNEITSIVELEESQCIEAANIWFSCESASG